MELKKFSEYTSDEQKEIMFHWWSYYGKKLLTLAEMQKFDELMNNDMNFLRNVALVSFCGGYSSQILVNAMRDNSLDELKANIAQVVLDDEFLAMEEQVEADFLSEMIRTYNNPEPPIPIDMDTLTDMIIESLELDANNCSVIGVDVGALMKEVDAIKKSKKEILTAEKVHEVYYKCLLTDEEVSCDEPLVDFTVGEGVMNAIVFNAERLESHKKQIIEMIDELPNLEQAPSFLELCFDKNGRQWTGDHGTMDFLMKLGTAVGAITYPLPKEVWDAIGGVPLVFRARDKDDELVHSHKPKEFKKVREQINDGTYRKGTK